jgi:undecaprenyl-diphosphatase
MDLLFMLKLIRAADHRLFEIINQGTANSVADNILPFFRAPLFWAPLYIFLLLTVILQKPKQALLWTISWITTIAATDLISSRLIKPFFGRLRPCNNPELQDSIRILVDHCGQNGSFTSSHAANHFGMAMFFFITLKWKNKFLVNLFFIWAALIAYAQVYVGVHFPTDVIGGCVLGLIVGKISGTVHNHFNHKLEF